jgi:carbon storage regulator CsrA
MLILSRLPGESIIIDGKIVVTILAGNGRSQAVRVGIEAPPEMEILREELLSDADRDAVAASKR